MCGTMKLQSCFAEMLKEPLILTTDNYQLDNRIDTSSSMYILNHAHEKTQFIS